VTNDRIDDLERLREREKCIAYEIEDYDELLDNKPCLEF
jgi:hypothetical protein